MVVFAAGELIVATGAWFGAVTVIVRVTAVEARPRLSRTVRLAVKVPAVA